jgi:hypothetical protein
MTWTTHLLRLRQDEEDFSIEVWKDDERLARVPAEFITGNDLFNDDTPEEYERGQLVVGSTLRALLSATGWSYNERALKQALVRLTEPGPPIRDFELGFVASRTEDRVPRPAWNEATGEGVDLG